jgi:guanosine-3',5'-bis(diphosphate) 3'-pyrophosphohydrolase
MAVTETDGGKPASTDRAVEALVAHLPAGDRAVVEKAYEFARRAHEGQLRRSGETYFSHCLAVAQILAELNLETASICAGLLHDVLEDTPTSFEQLQKEFPEPIPRLVEGVTKISALHFYSDKEKQAENLRKMILACARDIRVVLIKLCDRLHNMRTLSYLSPEKQVAIAHDTLEIYAPLANRLGMSRICTELEDLSMRYLSPDEFRSIEEKIADNQLYLQGIIDGSIRFLENKLGEHGLKVSISGRIKNIYSIYRKMKAKRLEFEQVADLIALRIITDSIENCYNILGLVHSYWPPIPGMFDDYIAFPKGNLYQSLHTTVSGLLGERVEIQIRTEEMHRISEEGIASHWRYKEGLPATTKQAEVEIDKRLNWLRHLTEWLKEIPDPTDFLDALKQDVFSDVALCFTPKGDVVELPNGATPLDFAYDIHTEIGHRCVGAKVNNRIVPLNYALHSGDMVEIITSKGARPSPGWLEIVKTSRARSKIRHYLKTQDYEQNVARGRELLLRAIKNRNLALPQAKLPELLEPHLKALRVNSFDELLSELGFGSMTVGQVVTRLAQESPEPPGKPALPVRQTGRQAGKKTCKSKIPSSGRSGGVLVPLIPDALVRFAGCCSPIPGDAIVGFITRGRGVSIHKEECPSLKRIRASGDEVRERFVDAVWDEEAQPLRKVVVKVVARDRKGLLKDVTAAISAMNIMILANTSKTFPVKNQAILKFQIAIEDSQQLNELLNRIEAVEGVISLTRITRIGET